jgi:TrmH family RNA methyltransferase
VLFAGPSVDLYNGKLVRATAGSLFHLDVVVDLDPEAALAACAAAGSQVLATSGGADAGLDELAAAGVLDRPTAWMFGNEARGLPAELLARADRAVRVPIYGRVESLNLAAAAAVCLYSSAREHHRAPAGR